MRYFVRTDLRLFYILFIVLTIFGSVCAHAQSDPSTHTFLNITRDDDDDEEEKPKVEVAQQQAEAPKESDNQEVYGQKGGFKPFIFMDLGTNDLEITHLSGTAVSAHGPVFAFSGQLAYQFRTKADYKRLFISAGLEIKAFRSRFTFIDSKYGILHDDLSFVYAGVPVMLQYVNTKHHEGHSNDVNWYLQIGASVDQRVMITQANGSATESSGSSINGFKGSLIQPFFSAGISYTTPTHVYLIGPFASYAYDNISTLGSVTAGFETYGIRLSALLFR